MRLPWGRHPCPIQGNTALITAAETPDVWMLCVLSRRQYLTNLPSNLRMAYQLRGAASVALCCANFWAVPLGKK